MQTGETQFVERRIGRTRAAEFGAQAGQFFNVAALGNPFGTQRRQALTDVNFGLRVGIRAGTVINVNRRVFFTAKCGIGIGLRNLAHRDLNVRARTFNVNLAGIGQRLDCSLVDVGVGGEELFFGVHECSRRGFSGVRRTRSNKVRFPTAA
jgi:hypothetical protein